MKSLSLAVAVLLLASQSPAAAQYSYSGSAGALRTAPSKDKAASVPGRPTSPVAPALTGQMNRTGPQAAEGQRTQGPPKPPTRFGTPLSNIPGQARPVPGVAR